MRKRAYNVKRSCLQMKIAPFFLLQRTTKSPRMRALIFRPPVSRSFFSREPRGSFLIGRQRYRLILMALSRPSMAVCSSCMAAWRRGGRLLMRQTAAHKGKALPSVCPTVQPKNNAVRLASIENREFFARMMSSSGCGLPDKRSRMRSSVIIFMIFLMK